MTQQQRQHFKARHTGEYLTMARLPRQNAIRPRLVSGPLLLFLILLLLHAQGASAVSGDDFTNNLVTDIAPLLALFGDDVAKQFLAGSTGWADNVIFAMGALGIITAMVSAIRVGGPVWLKSIIGRARESRADVEVEIMSSTSTDVCELWNGQAIVRMVGSPNILELILSEEVGEDEKEKEEEGEEEKGAEDKETRLARRYYKIHDFQEAVSDRVLIPADPAASYSRRDNAQSADAEDGLLHQDSVPNISLSVNGGGAGPGELFIVALIGIIVQSAVVCLAGVEMYVDRWKDRFTKDDQPVWAGSLWLMAIGTAALSVGMVMCAHIISSSSTLEEWKANTGPGREVWVAWLQQGGRIGDEEFGSFFILSRGSTRLKKSHRARKPSKEGETFVAVMITLGGFVAQFSALRFLHFSVTLCQLVAIGFMTALRAVIRRHIAYPPDVRSIPRGMELEWMARKLTECQSWELAFSEPSKEGMAAAEDAEGRNQRLAVEVFNARHRLQTLSKWNEPPYGLALRLHWLINSILNERSFLAASLPLKKEFRWLLPIRVSSCEASEDSLQQTIFLRATRRIRRGSWTPWNADLDGLASVLGLLVENQRSRAKKSAHKEARSLHSRRCLRVMGKIPLDDDQYRLWIPRDAEGRILTGKNNLVEELAKMGVEECFVFPRIYDGNLAEGITGFVLEAPPEQMLAQILFSIFLEQISVHFDPVTDIAVRSHGKPKLESFTLHSQALDKITDYLSTNSIATEIAAYISVVPPLLASGVFPRVTDKRVLLSILRELRREEDLGGGFMWLQHQVELSAKMHRAKRQWREVRELYGRLRSSCDLVYGPANRHSIAAQESQVYFQTYLHHLQLIPSIGVETPANSKDAAPPLLRACKSHDPGLVALLIDRGADLRARDATGRNALHTIVDAGCLQVLDNPRSLAPFLAIIRLLLLSDRGLLLESDFHGRTALSIALKKDVEAFTALLEFYDTYDRGRDTSFLCAARGDNDKLARFLLQNGADPAAKDADGQTVLHIAASRRLTGLMQLMIDKYASNINAKNKDGQTPLHVAISEGKMEAAKLLLKNGADLQAGDNSVLQHMVRVRDDEPMAHLLLQSKADPEEKDARGWTPLHHAAANNFPATAKVLLAAGAEASACDAHGWTPLHAAVTRGAEVALIQLLLNKGASPSATDGYGWTPLHMAAFYGHEEIARLLIDRGAPVVAPDADGWTPLEMAAFCGHEALVDLLLSCGGDAQVDQRDRVGWTALHRAAGEGHVSVVELLLHHGSNKGAKNANGETPLDLAIRNGHASLASILG